MSSFPFFDSVKLPKLNRNLFDKSFENKLTCNMGMLIPIFCEDVVPGDKYQISPEILVRTAPMLAPIMHRVDIYTHTFFVPKRLIWDDFQDYISGGKDGSLAPVKPYFTYKQVGQFQGGSGLRFLKTGSLADYFGLPSVPSDATVQTVTSTQKIDALPFRAYLQIYNDYYRDQNLTNEVNFSKLSGQIDSNELANLLTIRRRAWHKDYFTSALPFAQRGPEVALPMGTSAPVNGIDSLKYVKEDGQEALRSGAIYLQDGGSSYGTSNGKFEARYQDTTSPLKLVGTLTADLTNATAVTINALRRASALQHFLERSALGGSRLIESNFAHFGVMGKDYRYQRAEYLGGSCQNLMISEVLQNSISEASSASQGHGALGSMAGHGLSAAENRPITHYFDEQGYIITLLSVLPRASYQQGIPRMFSRFDRLDEYFPEFAHLGEQEVLKQELYFSFNASDDDSYNKSTFGYQSRYSDMKYRADEVHGDFKESLDFWHLGRKFNGSGSSYETSTKPVLNASFIECYPTNRVFNITSDDVHKLWIDVYFKVKALRPMPIFGTPQF